ncbi:uncharacterized protein LOC117576016 [Drosophila albomicans]|uniref:Uncharacterized protein LOC117576016 n=1 Tax=Drosophila albomicans TaxID=7291 RepID=A0A6P8XSW0_DROAB|nr:uncharacterized protein LOC117576016 [Drosophila albomicans]
MSSPRDQLRCSRKGCKYTTNRSYNLERHERNHEKGKVPVSQCQPCPHCPYAAGSLHNLMRHISKKHVNASPVKKENGRLVSVDPVKEEEMGDNEEKDEETKMEQSTPPTEQTLQATVHKSSPKRERKPLKPASVSEQLQRASLWDWSTLQQQEKNFQRRYGLATECKIHRQTVNLFKLYALVRARGGALNVDAWDDVASSLGFATRAACGRHVRDKYMGVLIEFEKREEERLEECKDFLDVPSWWDDGNFVGANKDHKPNVTARSESEAISPFNNNVRSAIVKIIFNKYYKKHLRGGDPFKRFNVKDSWLRATMLSSHALISQMHFKHYSP